MHKYECEIHGRGDDLGAFDNPGCATCLRITKILEAREARGPLPPRTKLREEVYWPTNNSHEGRLIHNLEHKPQFFAMKEQYRNYLKHNQIREAR